MGEQGEPSVWDENYEHVFQRADDGFPSIIQKLDCVSSLAKAGAKRTRFVSFSLGQDQLDALVEGAVSLAIRSPVFRERCVALAESLRGPLPERERNRLIGANQRHCQARFSRSFKQRCVGALLVAPKRNLIFGDGVYSTISPPEPGSLGGYLLVAITPNMAVLLCQPLAYSPDRRLSVTQLSDNEVKVVNWATQVYSKRYLFFTGNLPQLEEPFLARAHGSLCPEADPIRRFAEALPGVSSRLGI